MKLKRNTGLVLSLVLILAPATAAVAKPVASHHLSVSWNSTESKTWVYGSIDFVVDQFGTPTVDFLRVESGPCEDVTQGGWTESFTYSGAVESLSVTIDRHLETITIVGDLAVSRTVTNPCAGHPVEPVSEFTVDLSGSSGDRPVRARDRDSGDRTISRLHGFVLGLNEELILDQGMVTKTISRA